MVGTEHDINMKLTKKSNIQTYISNKTRTFYVVPDSRTSEVLLFGPLQAVTW